MSRFESMKFKLSETFRGGLLSSFLKLAIFLVVTVMLSTVLATTIRGGTREAGDEYSAIFSDATMVEEGDDVRIAGVVVGHITGFEVHDRTRARVDFTISEDVELPRNVQGQLRFRNMVGQRYLNLSRDADEAAPALEPGETIPIKQTTPAVDLTALFNGFRPLFNTLDGDDVNALAESLIQVFQGEGGTVTNLVQQTGQLTNHLADRDRVIGEVINNLTDVLETINNRDTEFQQLVVTLRQLIEGLDADSEAIGSSIDSIADLTSVAENVVSQTRPQVTESLTHLQTVTDDLVAHEDSLAQVLTNMPVKTDGLIRQGSFGSWFQFYLCGIDVSQGPGENVPNLLPSGGPPLNHMVYTNSANRCHEGGMP